MTTAKRRWNLRCLAIATSAAACSLVVATAAQGQGLPSRLADTTFWRMVTTMSEPGGYFRSDNLVSNETSFQYVIPELQRTTKPGGVYLGVAPDQNFTFMVALHPKMAFIVDIRRGALLHHLMYKAILERARDRADFVSMLFSRARPAGLDTSTTVDSIFRAFDAVAPDTVLYHRNFDAIRELLRKGHGFALADSDFASMEYIYDAFYRAGPHLTYNFTSGGGGYGGAFGGRGSMPDYEQLMTETDGREQRSYLANEENYRVLRDLQAKNLLVPLTGNFAGDKALRGVGQYLRDHGATVTAFYTSNVEQYLFQDNIWRQFYANVATLPIDASSTFIRSQSNGPFGGTRVQSPRSRQLELLCSIADLLKAFNEGRITSYADVLNMSR